MCEDVQMQAGSNSFMLDLFVIPLEEFDVVLGVHWLQTLGKIVWDFSTPLCCFNELTRKFLEGC